MYLLNRFTILLVLCIPFLLVSCPNETTNPENSSVSSTGLEPFNPPTPPAELASPPNYWQKIPSEANCVVVVDLNKVMSSAAYQETYTFIRSILSAENVIADFDNFQSNYGIDLADSSKYKQIVFASVLTNNGSVLNYAMYGFATASQSWDVNTFTSDIIDEMISYAGYAYTNIYNGTALYSVGSNSVQMGFNSAGDTFCFGDKTSSVHTLLDTTAPTSILVNAAMSNALSKYGTAAIYGAAKIDLQILNDTLLSQELPDVVIEEISEYEFYLTFCEGFSQNMSQFVNIYGRKKNDTTQRLFSVDAEVFVNAQKLRIIIQHIYDSL